MSGPETSARFVITADTRRQWPAAAKRAIVTEAAQAKSVSEVARRHAIAPGLLYRWRRQLAKADRGCEQPAAVTFLPVALPVPPVASPPPARRSGMIEIELAGGRRVRVDGAVDVGALKRIVDVLEGR